jgi:hypothetical protein
MLAYDLGPHLEHHLPCLRRRLQFLRRFLRLLMNRRLLLRQFVAGRQSVRLLKKLWRQQTCGSSSMIEMSMRPISFKSPPVAARGSDLAMPL